MNEARIKLAEAMGWKFCRSAQVPYGGYKKTQPCWIQPGCELIGVYEQLPDPFINANDDVAVLELMRGGEDAEETPEWRAFKDFFIEVYADSHTWNYQIGDYARAACKVLAID